MRFVGFGDASLNLEVFAYVRTSDWNEFLGIQEDIYLRMMDVVAASGTAATASFSRLFVASIPSGPDGGATDRFHASWTRGLNVSTTADGRGMH